MKRLPLIPAFIVVAIALLLTQSPVFGQFPITPLQPGSALLFPLFDSTPGAGTLLCVTNLNTSQRYCSDTDYREGDVLLHYLYIAGDDCLEFDRSELLTPGDTLCVTADLHNPEGDRGFLVVSSMDPSTGERIEFNHLIGSAIVVQSSLNFLWSYVPYPFLGFPGAAGPIGIDCPRERTDHDGDGAMDFGSPHEYNFFPSDLYLASFLEERDSFTNQLTLMSTAGQDYINEVEFVFWNNMEEKYSRTFKFVCWWSGPLSEISQIVTDLDGDETELGHPPVETGWVHIRGNRVLDLAGNPIVRAGGSGEILAAPILGVFAQLIEGTSFAAGNALHTRRTDIVDGFELPVGDSDHIGP